VHDCTPAGNGYTIAHAARRMLSSRLDEQATRDEGLCPLVSQPPQSGVLDLMPHGKDVGTMLEEEYQATHRPTEAQRNLPPLAVPFEYQIREARAEDLPSVREIYNHYVANSTVTFDEVPMTLKELRAKFQHLAKLGMPFIVAESPSGQLLGYAYVYPWKEKAAYRYTVENSIYLGPAATGKGLGRRLLAELIDRSKAAGLKEIIAVIADRGADASIAMHRSFGFKEIGHMGKVGFKFDRWLGTILMQKSLK
jgi:L-amino acid N-acyltransferase YncA